MTRYDSMNSINEIYSQISKPLERNSGAHMFLGNHHRSNCHHYHLHQKRQQTPKNKKSKDLVIPSNNTYLTANRPNEVSRSYIATAANNKSALYPLPYPYAKSNNTSQSPHSANHQKIMSSRINGRI